VLEALPLPPAIEALPERGLTPAEAAALERMLRDISKQVERAR